MANLNKYRKYRSEGSQSRINSPPQHTLCNKSKKAANNPKRVWAVWVCNCYYSNLILISWP